MDNWWLLVALIIVLILGFKGRHMTRQERDRIIKEAVRKRRERHNSKTKL